MVRGYQQGVLAMVPAAVAASSIAAALHWTSPLESDAEELMQRTPVPVANFLLFHLGSLARPAALLGALAVAMLAGGIAGGLGRVPGRSAVGIAAGYLLGASFLLGVFLLLFVPADGRPELFLVAAFVIALAIIDRDRRQVSGRREFLERTAVIVGGAAVLVTLFSVRPLLRALATRRLFPFLAPVGLHVPGVSPLVTPVDQFYVMDKVLEYPEIGPPSWKLVCDGLVRHPLQLDYGSLLSRPPVNRYVTMECVDNPVGGPLMSNALWTGLPVGQLLNEVGVTGDTVVFYGVDEYAEGVPVSILRRHGAIIAYGMNGQVLSPVHGYPARLVLPGVYGFKSIKWLTRLEVIRGPFTGHWRAHGWNSLPIIHTTARLDLARRSGGEVLAAGVAFAGIRGIRAVEVRMNGGPWHRAKLGPILAGSSWVQWVIRIPGDRGGRLEARAIDGSGHIQSGRSEGAFPDGAAGWHSVEV